MQKSDSMAPEYELDGHASSLIYAFKRGAKHLTDIFAYSKWTLPQKGSLLVDHVIISNCPSTRVQSLCSAISLSAACDFLWVKLPDTSFDGVSGWCLITKLDALHLNFTSYCRY